MQVRIVLEVGYFISKEEINSLFQRLQSKKLQVEDSKKAVESNVLLTQIKTFVEDLIDKSYDSWKTTKYD
jgi:hypothetical protein